MIRRIESKHAMEVSETLAAMRGPVYAAKASTCASIVISLESCEKALTIDPVIAATVLPLVVGMIKSFLPSLADVHGVDVESIKSAMTADTDEFAANLRKSGD